MRNNKIKYFWVNRGSKESQVTETTFKKLVKDGWVRGRPSTKKKWADPMWRRNMLLKRRIGWSTEEAKHNGSMASKKKWADPKIREKYLKSHWSRSDKRDGVIKGNSTGHKELAASGHIQYSKEHMAMMTKKSSKNKEINKEEKQVLYILDKLFPGEYKWVGGFEVKLGNFYPDFINVNGQKKIIEFFGRHWHADPRFYKPADIIYQDVVAQQIWEKDRRRLSTYRNFGYKTLVVWGEDLKDVDSLRKRIVSFHNNTGRPYVSNIS